MTIKDSENELFKNWRRKYKDKFVEDGIVNEKAYLNSSPKLLFVLKEVNDSDSGDWDLRKFLKKGGQWQTWNNVARWVEGIRMLPNEIHWEKLGKINLKRRKKALSFIAAINIKKIPGGGYSNNDELDRFARENKDFLKKQFGLYNSDVIVCCSTWYLLEELFGKFNDSKWTSRGVRFCEYKGKFIVDYWHPQARYPAQFLYYGLVDALREILALTGTPFSRNSDSTYISSPFR